MRSARHRSRSRHRLFWRIYLNGIFLLLAVTTAVTAVALLGPGGVPWHGQQVRLAHMAGADVRGALPDSQLLQTRLEELTAILAADLAVRRPDGSLLAWAGRFAPPPLAARELGQLAARPGGLWTGPRRLAVALESGGPYLVVTFRVGHGPGRFAASAAAILAAVALASYPLARAIARPLEQLTATSRILAEGDLSARTGMERRDEVGALAGAIDDMADRLQHRIRAEREMLANISHEIRTPLSRIRVALELSEEEEGAERVKEHLSGIRGDVAELDRLVEDVLGAVRLDLAGAEGGFHLRRESVPIADLVARALERFSDIHPGRLLDCRVEEGLPPLWADPGLLRRVIENLLDNAAKYSPSEATIELGAELGSGEIVLEVRDQGIGAEEKDLARLFEPFFRAERSRTRSAGGVGLGLTLCQRIVEAHGGRIAAFPNSPRGLILRVTLPLGEPETAA